MAGSDSGYEPAAVTRRISAPAEVVFGILADPVNHLALDGSGMLRGAVTTDIVTGVGDVFVMRMFYEPYGEYEMNNHVVEYVLNRRIGWEPEAGRGHPARTPGSTENLRWGHRWSYELAADGPEATIVTEIYDCSAAPLHEQEEMGGGRIWTAAMAATLDRLAALCGARSAQRQPRARPARPA